MKKAPVISIESVPDMWQMGLPLGNGRVGVLCRRNITKLNFSMNPCAF